MSSSFKLISWNILAGGGKRIAAQTAALVELQPDVIALQEVNINTAPNFATQLAAHGYPYTLHSFQNGANRELHRAGGARRYGVLIAGKTPLELVTLTPLELPWAERALAAYVTGAWGKLEIFNVYVPIGSTPNSHKPGTLEIIYDYFSRASEHLRLLCGDFNTPKAESTDGKVTPFAPKVRATPELNIMTGLAQHGLPDVFRRLHGYGVNEHSWVCKNRGRQFGYRLDHIFASPALNPVSCRYIHALREQRLSDHSPIEAIFAPEITSGS
jgi:exonuclease III